jgi:hypothetical protein
MGRRGDRPYIDYHAYNRTVFHVEHPSPFAEYRPSAPQRWGRDLAQNSSKGPQPQSVDNGGSGL